VPYATVRHRGAAAEGAPDIIYDISAVRHGTALMSYFIVYCLFY